MAEAAAIGSGAGVDERRCTPLLPLKARALVLEADGKRLIDGLDLTLTDNAMTTLMGPNGAGKSLLLRLLHGLIAPTSGEVAWNGVRPSEAVRRRQAMVFQDPVLLRRSVAANVEFVLKLDGRNEPRRCAEILQSVELAAHADQPARLLSGGEKQRLALARALARAPEVLFLDEPTASLDPASTALIEAAAKRARDDGTKVVFVTHDIGQARRLGGEVVFMHKGRVCEQRPAKAFFNKPVSREARDYLAGRLVL
ncbi:MAG: ATP-binding cassette domain-containing protein [Hyphomicrobiales bacterium]|nr:ATP-binding cassette domain-containing protein [Hyphomicrobiales bacterium]